MKVINFFSFLTISLVSISLLGLPMKGNAVEPITHHLIAQTSEPLTEEKVQQAMAAIKKAESEEDIDTLLNFLVPYTVSEITVESQGKSVTHNIEGVEAHRELLKKMFDRIKDRKTLNEYSTIRIIPDGQLATVTRTNTEELTTEDGKRFLSSGTDTFRIAWINNQAKVISSKSQGWIEERPAASKP
jgi:hypothetical protein